MISAAWPRSASSLARARAAAVLPEAVRSEEHTSELQSHLNLVCRLLLETQEHTSELQSHLNIVCRPLVEKYGAGLLPRFTRSGRSARRAQHEPDASYASSSDASSSLSSL